jgi:hypothetical protein
MNESPATEDKNAVRNPGKLNVLFITGWGHSGSTLLARLLGSAPDIASHGELKYFIDYSERNNKAKIPSPFFCACGVDFGDCDFWRGVHENMRDITPPGRCTGIAKRLWAAIQFFLRLRTSDSDRSSELALLRATIQSSGRSLKYLLDPSKDFTRMMRLLMIPEVNVIPIYLVRDVRGVAYSYRKPRRNQLTARRKSFPEATLLWLAIHLVNRGIFRFAHLQPIHISYAGLCAEPNAYLAKLGAILGTDMPLSCEGDEIGPLHYIGGNWMKWKPVGDISDDDEWRATETRWQRICYRLSGAAKVNRRWALRDDFLDD